MTTLYLIIAAAAAFFAAERVFNKYSLRGVGYSARVSRELVERGEEFELITEITNAKRLPEFFAELTETLPNGAEPVFDGAVVTALDGRKLLKRSFYMMPRQKLTGRVRLVINGRGRYFMRDAEIVGGDFLGINSNYKHFSLLCGVSVLPARYASVRLERLLGGFFGEISVNRFIMPDPVLSVGVAEYSGREPQRDINWAQSARAGRLLVNKRDFTTELAVTVILDTSSPYPKDAEKIEDCLSMARSVVETLEKRGVKFAFMTNALSATMRGVWRNVGDGGGRRHLENVLECLACASYETRESSESLLKKAREKAEQGRSHVIVSAAGVSRAEIERLKYLTGGAVLALSPEIAGKGAAGL